MKEKYKVLWSELHHRSHRCYSKTIKSLKDLKKVNWKNVFQIDIALGRKRTEFVVRITEDGIKVVYPIEIKNVIWGNEIKK